MTLREYFLELLSHKDQVNAFLLLVDEIEELKKKVEELEKTS